MKEVTHNLYLTHLVIEYQIGKVGEKIFVVSTEIGRTKPAYNEFKFYDNDLQLEKEQSLAQYLRGSVNLWSCKRYDPVNLKCVFFYSGGEFDILTFKIRAEKELYHLRTQAVPMYPGMIPRRAHLLQNDLLFIYFSKRYDEVGSRHDDHKGFYAYKLEEDGSYTILGGAGSDHIGQN